MSDDEVTTDAVSVTTVWPDWVAISSDYNDPGGADPDVWTAECSRDHQTHQGTLQECADWGVTHFGDPEPPPDTQKGEE